MLKKKMYAIIGGGMLITMITTYLSIKALIETEATMGIIFVLAINLGVYAALVIGLLEYLVFSRIKMLAKDLQDAENKQRLCKLIDVGDDDEISFIAQKLNQSLEALKQSNEEHSELVIQYKPSTTAKRRVV